MTVCSTIQKCICAVPSSVMVRIMRTEKCWDEVKNDDGYVVSGVDCCQDKVYSNVSQDRSHHLLQHRSSGLSENLIELQIQGK